MYIRITPKIVNMMKRVFLFPTNLFTHPKAIASPMKKIEAEATPGLATKVLAMMSAKTPMTNIKVEKLNMMNSCLPRIPI